MLTPNSIKNSECSLKVMNLLNLKSNYGDLISEQLADNFQSNTSYMKVIRNFDKDNIYDTWIYEGNEKDKIVGYKYLQSYPYNEIKFSIGDYISFDYNKESLSTWLLCSLDTQLKYDVKGRILLCNNQYKWIDSKGNIKCYPCVIQDAMTYTNFKYGTQGVVEQGADIVVLIQQNDDTKSISVDDRAVFNGRTFKVKQKMDLLNPGYMEIYLLKTSELAQDNLKNNIAFNGNEDDAIKENVDDGIRILPSVTTINPDETITFTVYSYRKGRQQAHAFNVFAENIPNANYELTIISANSFSIKNLESYINNPLLITCVDTTTQTSTSIDIWLGSGW